MKTLGELVTRNAQLHPDDDFWCMKGNAGPTSRLMRVR